MRHLMTALLLGTAFFFFVNPALTQNPTAQEWVAESSLEWQEIALTRGGNDPTTPVVGGEISWEYLAETNTLRLIVPGIVHLLHPTGQLRTLLRDDRHCIVSWEQTNPGRFVILVGEALENGQYSSTGVTTRFYVSKGL